MKSQEPQEKKFRQLSDQELEKVNGGSMPKMCNFIECAELGKETDPKTCECI